uniref:Putative signal transduction protein n=1 Tax=Magnetococcus massalia (strain MO-1) TaxID=451514 RepID=A0A1S7LNJ7_MAGMO|nr:HDOD domain-containing protein [Candidatus Magnetococcus massalia]CRH08248.1 putative signal transduction protein [Candidatus Magnetococcus massalia]CRH08315.1 putative signal transduction protein [Candidatus Magnetococcus massalia]
MAELPNTLLRQMDGMPAFPRSVRQVLHLTSDANIQPKDLLDVIVHDPVLTLKILQRVNAPFFGLSHCISSINHAVVYVGFNTIKNLAIHTANQGILPAVTAGGVNTSRFHNHAITVAVLSRALARRMGVEEPITAEFYLAGLLHDVGKLALSSAFPDAYRMSQQMVRYEGASLIEAEQEQLKTDHAIVGAALAAHWHLPDSLVRSIGEHHAPTGDGEETIVRDCVFVANQLATLIKLRGDDAEETELTPMPDFIRDHMGADYDTLAAELGDVMTDLDETDRYVHQSNPTG